MTTAADIQIGVNLIDDYLSIDDAPVADDLVGRFVVVQDLANSETASELLTVAPDGSLAHFYPDSSSHSGWGLETLAVTSPVDSTDTTITQLAGFYDSGVLQTLCYFATDEAGVQAAAWMYSTAPGSWQNAPLTNDANNCLYYTYQTDTYTAADGTNYVYGITKGLGSPAFYVVMYDDAEQAWQVEYAQYLSDFSPQLTTTATFRLAPGSASDDVTVLWAEAGTTTLYCRPASTANGAFEWTGSAQPIDTSSYGAITVDQIFPCAGTFGEDNLLLLDTSGALYLVSGFNQQTTSITRLTNPDAAQGNTDPIDQPQPVGAIVASAGVDNAGNQNILAIETGTASLWFFCIASDGSYDPTTDWVNLGGPYDTIACPASMIYGPELFAVDLNNSVYHKALTPESTSSQSSPVWVTGKIAQPVASSDTPQSVSSYAMHVQPVDANGNPVANQVIEVTADHAVTVVVNDIAHSIGPSTPLPLATDGSGQLTVNYQSLDLKPPVITFTISGATVSRWCQGDSVEVKSTDTDPVAPSTQSVSNRLQNNDPTRTVSNSSLTTAQTQTGTCPATGQDKSIPQLMSQSYADGDPDGSACTSLMNVGSWIDPNNTNADGTIDASRLPVRHWRIDFAHPDGVRYEILTEAQARTLFAEAEKKRQRSTGLAALGGSSGGFGHVCEFFKHMFTQLSTFAATVEQDATTGLYELKVAFNETMTFIVSTAKDAGAAAETIFSKIADGIEAVANDVYSAIERVIEWLKMLFEWEDIVHTHTVIKNAINTGLKNLITTFADADTAICGWLDTAQTEIDKALAQVESTFSESTSFNSLVNGLGPATGAAAGALTDTSTNTLANTQTQNTQQQNAGKANYVSSKANNYYGGQTSPTALSAAVAASSDPAGAITQAFVDSIFSNADYATYLKQLTDFMNDIWSNPQDFFNLIIQALFEAAMDIMNLVISCIEAVLTAIAGLVEDAINAAYDVLNATIDIPILSWLWENVISGSPLSFLDLVCLLSAVPVTIIYKLMYGAGNAPFSASDTSMTFSWQTNPFGALQSTGAPQIGTAETGVTADQMKALLTTSGILIALVQSAGQCTSDLAQLANVQGVPADPFTQWASRAACISAVYYQVVSGMALDWSGTSPGEQAAGGVWGISLFPLAANIIFTFFGSKQAITELVDTYGNDMTTCMQLVCLCFGIWAATTQGLEPDTFSGWDVADDVISPLPGLFACTMSTTPLAEDTVMGVFGYDLYTLLGTGIVTVGAAWADY